MSLRNTWSGDVAPSPELDLAQTLSRVRHQFPELSSSSGNLPQPSSSSSNNGRGPSPWQSPEDSRRDMGGKSLSASQPGRGNSPPSLDSSRWERDIAFLMAENAKIKQGMARASERLAQHKQELARTTAPEHEFHDRRSPFDHNDRLSSFDRRSPYDHTPYASEHRSPFDHSGTRRPSEPYRPPLSASLNEEDWAHMHPLPQEHGALFSSAPSHPTASSYAASQAASAAAAH
ncbi:hypothetical protein T484DRAFT_1893288, partial [Baffinella frigidus]